MPEVSFDVLHEIRMNEASIFLPLVLVNVRTLTIHQGCKNGIIFCGFFDLSLADEFERSVSEYVDDSSIITN